MPDRNPNRALRRTTRSVLFALLTVAGSGGEFARGDDTEPVSGSANQSLNQFFDANPDCLAVTDQCRVCSRSGADNVVCSNVGIACIAGEWSCARKSSDPASPTEAHAPKNDGSSPVPSKK